MEISAAAVKSLREETGAGIMDCKKALQDANGNVDKAKDLLREKGLASAAKKADRVARQGLIEPYIHSGRIGVLLEINCETDFVARTDAFKTLARDIAQQIVAMNPKYITRAEAPADAEVADTDILMEQVWIKDNRTKIEDLIKSAIAAVGENVVVRRFSRYELGA